MSQFHPPHGPTAAALLPLLTAVILGTTACHRDVPTSATLNADELARVGDTVITVAQFEAERARHPGTISHEDVLELLIRRELLYSEATATGFLERADTREAWRSFVISRFLEELDAHRPSPAVSDEEVAAYYEAHREAYASPERRRLAMIHLPLPAQDKLDENRRATLESEALAVRDKAMASAPAIRDFGEIALKHSAHRPSQHSGGDIGWVTRAQAGRAWPSSVADAAFALKNPGDISPLIASDEGWYLLRLLERQSSQPLPLERVRDRIRHELTRARTLEAEATRYAELRARHGVEVTPGRLAELESNLPSLAHRPPTFPAP